MASYDKTISASLQQLATLGMGDLSHLLIKGLPHPWRLIGTKVRRGIQAYICIGKQIGNNNQIALVLGSEWTSLLNSVSLQGYPGLRQEPLSLAIRSDPNGSDNAQMNISTMMDQLRCLNAVSQSLRHSCARQLYGLQVPAAPQLGSAEIVSFNGPLQRIYVELREELWNLMQLAASLVTTKETELFICGQGIGAAYAQLAAYDFRPDKEQISIEFKKIRLYTYSAPLNASAPFQALFNQSIPDAWIVNAGKDPIVDFFPTEPTVDEKGYPLAPLGTEKPIEAVLPNFDAPWWERSGPFYTDSLNDANTQASPQGAGSTTADGYDSQLSYILMQLCAGAAQRAQHPQLAPPLPSSWSLVKAFPDINPWMCIFHRPSPDLYAVVFRSDLTYAEVMNNLANSSADRISWLPKTAGVHGGAYDIYENIRNELRTYLSSLDLSKSELVITGHSLGAMCAMIATLDLNTNPIEKGTSVNAYCFGSPAAASYDLFGNYSSLQKNVFLVRRIQDVIYQVTWNNLLTYFGQPVTVSGITNFDGSTYHAINAYIALLDPNA